jgi:hypothetical protein
MNTNRRKSPPPPPDPYIINQTYQSQITSGTGSRYRAKSPDPSYEVAYGFDRNSKGTSTGAMPSRRYDSIEFHEGQDSTEAIVQLYEYEERAQKVMDSGTYPVYESRASNSIDPAKKRPHNRSCCCKNLKTILLILTGFLILLGVALFLLFPRVPHVSIIKIENSPVTMTMYPQSSMMKLNTTNATSEEHFEVDDISDPPKSKDPSNTPITGMSVQYTPDGYIKLSSEYNIHLFINSTNYIPWSVKLVSISAFFPKSGSACVGTGNLTNILLPSLSSTTLIFPLHVEYYALYHSDRKNVQDPIFVEMVSQCQKYNTLATVMEIQVVIPMVSWLGIKPTFSIPSKIPCSLIMTPNSPLLSLDQ